MSIQKNISVSNHSYPVDYPSVCPICHHHGDIQIVKAFEHPHDRNVEVAFQCPMQGCKGLFIGYYGPRGQKELLNIVPKKPNVASFPDVIGEISPQFLSIYAEAEEARSLGLEQIAGPGYRKAFEFLIKDYASSLDVEKTSEIQGAFSGNVVKEYIQDPRIQAVAKRALWLGNDETHYLKKWTDHDVQDLVTLIRLAINWIEIERLSEQYQDDMPD
jgi:hypothetical protein